MMKKYLCLFAVLFSLSCLGNAYGQNILASAGKEFKVKKLQVPYAFYNEDFGASAGYVYGLIGWPQRQATTVATLIGGTNDTIALYFLARNVQSPFFDRLFIDPDFSVGTFGTIESHAG